MIINKQLDESLCNNTYSGYKIWQPTEEDLATFYTTNTLPLNLLENQYLFILNNENQIIDKKCFQNDKFRNVKYLTFENKYIGTKIKARNDYQAIALDLLQDTVSKVKVIRGVYGSGKDFLMLNYALYCLDKAKFEKIIFIRPNLTVKDLPDIGALPGTADEKLSWTLGPFLDKIGGTEGINYLIDSGKLEVVPLLYIRGRSFENSLIYVTEGQNMTTEIIKLLLGRVGDGSELWINGDTHQVDKKVFELDNGILTMTNRLKGNKLFGCAYLPITERSSVANLANLLD